MRIDSTEMKKQTDIKTDRWTQKQRENLRKPNTVCCQCWSPRYRLTLLSTKCGVCHLKGLIIASSHKINQITIITILTLICESQFSFLLDKKKKSTETLFFPTSSP